MYDVFKSGLKRLLTFATVVAIGGGTGYTMLFTPFQPRWINAIPVLIIVMFALVVFFSDEARFIGHPEIYNLEQIEAQLHTMNRSKDTEISELRRIIADRNSSSRRSSSLRSF